MNSFKPRQAEGESQYQRQNLSHNTTCNMNPTQHHLKNLTRQAKTCEALMWQAHDYLRGLVPEMGFKFLDLGCAPGGFSSYLLQDPRLDRGFVWLEDCHVSYGQVRVRYGIY